MVCFLDTEGNTLAIFWKILAISWLFKTVFFSKCCFFWCFRYIAKSINVVATKVVSMGVDVAAMTVVRVEAPGRCASSDCVTSVDAMVW